MTRSRNAFFIPANPKVSMGASRISRILSVLALVGILASTGLFAETRRALLIGINTYIPEASPSKVARDGSSGGGRNWENLKGCVNDIEAMSELLVKKFRFKQENVRTLSDQQATRAAIEAGIERLIAESSRGDVALFYFSGHGSRLIVVANGQERRIDETIVPVDSYRGTEDIRDKELARYFNRALDKGIILTAIFDSCHSGSICRGLVPLGSARGRFLREVRIDDPGLIEAEGMPKPEERRDLKERGILVLSAAQNDETAREVSDDEAAEGGRMRGAFSLALTKALAAVTVNEPVSRIFNRLPSTIYAQSLPQTPVLSGTEERLAAPLFGVGSGGASGAIAVAVLEKRDGDVILHGGSAIGLSIGCELRMEATSGQPQVRIRVTKVLGLAKSLAAVVEGSGKDVKTGSMFLVDKWANSGSGGAVKLWWPLSPPELRAIDAVRSQLAALKSSGEITWIQDPTEDSPEWIVGHDGRSWILRKGAEPAKALKEPLQAKEILDAVRAPGARPKVFIAVPPPSELVAKLAFGPGTANDALTRAEKDGEADYALVGRLGEGGFEVAWTAQNRIRDQIPTPLPVRNDWRPVKLSDDSLPALSTSLEDDAQSLQRVKGWLNLQSMNGEGLSFPYHLEFKNAKTGEMTKGPLRAGESFSLVLVRDNIPVTDAVKKMRIYIFAIDSWGRGTLLYPIYGELGNTLEKLGTGREIVLKDGTVPFTIGEPLGYDAYFLLTSEEPLGDPFVLNFKGARKRGEAERGPDSPLARLLAQVGSASRGKDASSAVPSRWTIDRCVVKSVPAK